MKPELLVRVERGGNPERFHYGFISVINENFSHALKLGEDDNDTFPFRSAAKPLQASVLIDAGVAEHFGFTGKELAIFCSSHAGSASHVKLVRRVLEKIGLTEEYLQCGVHAPLDSEEKIRLIRNYEEPKAVHNNCSGKHAGMLSSCVKNGWDLDTYLEKEHPLQQRIMENIKDLCLLEELPETVYDGCSALVPVLPYRNMGIGFLNLFLDPKYAALKTAIAENPYTMAEGLCLVINPDDKKVLVVKIADKSMKIRAVVTARMLEKLGWLTKEQISASQGLSFLCSKETKNWKHKVTGEIKTLF